MTIQLSLTQCGLLSFAEAKTKTRNKAVVSIKDWYSGISGNDKALPAHIWRMYFDWEEGQWLWLCVCVSMNCACALCLCTLYMHMCLLRYGVECLCVYVSVRMCFDWEEVHCGLCVCAVSMCMCGVCVSMCLLRYGVECLCSVCVVSVQCLWSIRVSMCLSGCVLSLTERRRSTVGWQETDLG